MVFPTETSLDPVAHARLQDKRADLSVKAYHETAKMFAPLLFQNYGPYLISEN